MFLNVALARPAARPPVRPGAVKRRVAGATLAGLVALGAATAFAPAAQTAPSSFADLAERVKPAVVNITSERSAGVAGAPGVRPEFPGLPKDSPFRDYFERFFGREFGDQAPNAPRRGQRPSPVVGAGSGFLVDADGHIVTNHHVVDGAQQIRVTLEGGQSFDAELVGNDPRTDLALLKIDAGRPLPFLEFGDSAKVRPGDWVMAVGNPFGLGGTVTAGIVSARGRDIAGGSLVDFLQIDAPINPGSSGGPTFDEGGKVIGVNTAIYSPNGGNVGIGFAIPSDTAREVVAALKKDGKVERGWLGVQIQPMTPELAQGFGLDKPIGALVSRVDDDGPAARAGLRSGDVVLAWDGKAVERARDLQQLVAATPSGRAVEVKLWRAGKERTVKVETGRMAERVAAAAAPGGQGDRSRGGSQAVPGTGLTVADLTAENRAQNGLDDAAEGAIVAAVEPNGPAARSGIRPGDVITRVGDAAVGDAKAVAAAVAKERDQGRETVVMMVARGDGERFVAVKLAKA